MFWIETKTSLLLIFKKFVIQGNLGILDSQILNYLMHMYILEEKKGKKKKKISDLH